MENRRTTCENLTSVESEKADERQNVCDQQCCVVDECGEMADSNVFQQDGESISAVVAKLIDPEKDKYLLEDSLEDNNKKGIPSSCSMQSIKDYEEEPRRSERSSVSSANEENLIGEEKTKLLTESDNVFEDSCTDQQKKIKGCIVTNV